jgi:hypothetical protein
MPEKSSEPQKSPEGTEQQRRTSWAYIVVFIALLLLAIPASLVAGWFGCFAAASAMDAGSGSYGGLLFAGVVAGGLSGLTVFGLMIWTAVSVLRRM